MSDKPQSTMIVEEVQISRKSKVFKYYIVTTECNFYVALMSSFMCIFPTINFWLHRYMQALSNKSYSGYNVVKRNYLWMYINNILVYILLFNILNLIK